MALILLPLAPAGLGFTSCCLGRFWGLVKSSALEVLGLLFNPGVPGTTQAPSLGLEAFYPTPTLAYGFAGFGLALGEFHRLAYQSGPFKTRMGPSIPTLPHGLFDMPILRSYLHVMKPFLMS